MVKSKITTQLSIIVILVGALVVTGWIMDIELLKSILPIWVTMKFITAISFILSGIILYFVTSHSFQANSDLTQIILSFAIIIILLLMVTLLFSSFLNIHSGVEDFFMIKGKETIQTFTPGRPSIGTMINFILVSAIGLITINDLKKGSKKIATLSILIITIGIIAILGYLFSIPIMYYRIGEFSSSMAVHTAILFILLGIGFLIHEKNNMKLLKQK